MMELSFGLQHKITEFLMSLPNLHNSDSQRAFLYKAGLDSQLRDQISIDQPRAEFIPLLISACIAYEKLNDGRYAIEAVLRAANEYVGDNKKFACNAILLELQRVVAQNESSKAQNQKNHGLRTRSQSQKHNIDLNIVKSLHYKEKLLKLLMGILLFTLFVLSVFFAYSAAPKVSSIIQSSPKFELKRTFLHPEAPIEIIAMNRAAQKKQNQNLQIRWDDVFVGSADLVQDSDPSRWVFFVNDNRKLTTFDNPILTTHMTLFSPKSPNTG